MKYDGSKGWLWSDTNCNTPLNFICQHQPKACGRPEQPPNSTMLAVRGYDVGATVEYACDEGHLLVGPASRTCLETGFYNEFPPVCKYIECGLPASIAHGAYELINGTVGYLSTVVYQCAEGFELVGRSILTCDIDERWNGPPPRCERIECDVLPATHQNAKFVALNGTFYGSKADVVCPRGYRVEGVKQLTCLSNGQWSHPLPSCVREEVIITTLPPTTNYRTRQPSSSRRPSRPSSRFTSTVAPPTATPAVTIITERIQEEDNEIAVPGTVREETIPRRTIRPNNGHAAPETTPPAPPKVIPLDISTTKNPQLIINAAHPQDNQIAGSVNISLLFFFHSLLFTFNAMKQECLLDK
uniref:Sushi domain-containing protein n=1 Tax=Phlebotomus papatasi TaxID=29031 RepID=A0A1B0GNI6_PHLPP